jgi:glucose-1-phosphate thymidylyltransferase
MNIEEKLTKIKNLKAVVDSFLVGKKEIEPGVFFGNNVVTEPNIFFDTKAGKIVIGDNVTIRAGSILRGPLLIEDYCKIGGEIEHAVFEKYSNKQHYGYVGHSYIGSWVNIGGGTSIATLKNTYSTIKLEGKDTGEQFLGAILEDGVKTAVNSSIFCGKVIGAHSHIYGIVTEDVPSFTSHISSGKLFELPLEIAIRAQKGMMVRRNVEFTDEHERQMINLFHSTEDKRIKLGVKKEKLNFSAQG